MDPTLIVGCSFAAIDSMMPLAPFDGIDYTKFAFCGMPAAGNQVIANKAKHEIQRRQFKKIIILWSGINRIDYPLSIDYHRRMPNNYKFIVDLGDPIWYLSGGMAGIWQRSDDCPKWVKDKFRDGYILQNARSASDTTLKVIADMQNWLKDQSIEYDMSFIYDINHDYHDRVDRESNQNRRYEGFEKWPQWLALEHCLGKLDSTAPTYQDVDWSKCRTIDTPYEWCESRGLLQPDRFHPTKAGMCQWFKSVMNIDLLS